MPIARVDDIIVLPDRQRKGMDPEKIAQLIDSITDRGLLHPIVIRQDGEQLVLVAGGRRLHAITELWRLGFTYRFAGRTMDYGTIPYTTVGEVERIQAEEMELDENLMRQDLSWGERAEAISRLHKLRTEQARAEGFVHTIQDTAEEVARLEDKALLNQRYLTSDVKQAVILAEHLDNPIVKNAKTAKDAFKALQREEQRQKNEHLAQVIGATFSAKSHRAFNVECLAWMKGEVAEQFDCILTDPPYGIRADTFGDSGGLRGDGGHSYDDSYDSWVKLMVEWSSLAFKLAKPQAHAYVFCDVDRFGDLKQFMTNAGWSVFRTPLIVYKQNGGRVPLPEHGPRRMWEMVLYANKGSRPVTFIYPDVIPCNGDDNLGHGAQKPVELYVNLLRRTVRPGDTVLDTFAGSGPIFPAAHALKCIATGTEKVQEYFGICLKRLKELEKQDELLGFAPKSEG